MTQKEQANIHKEEAQKMLNTVESVPFLGGKTTPHLGVPNNLSEFADLFIEGSLLPKPGGQRLPQAVPLEKSKFFMECLSREPQENWKKIHWVDSPATAKNLSSQRNKPIFLEMVVGRMGEKSAKVC